MWRTIKRCIRCCRANPPPVEYLIAFVHERDGIDYCGPFYIKERGDRNRRKIKIYAAISVCLETKAVHIQLVSDLTTGAFLAAHVDSSRGEDTAQPFLPTMTPISSGPTESCKNSGSYCSPTTTRRGYRIFSPTDRYNGVSILQTHHTLAIYGKPRWNLSNAISSASSARSSWPLSTFIPLWLKLKPFLIHAHWLPYHPIRKIPLPSLPVIF